MVLKKQSDEAVSVEVRGEVVCTEDEDFPHQSALETRKTLEEEITTGVGATEAYENAQNIHRDQNLTKEAARTHIAGFRRRQLVPDTWPRDVMLCLVLLRETQKEEISPEKKPVSGYIQVSGSSYYPT